MTNLDAYVNIPDGESRMCGEIEVLSLAGYFTCDTLAPLVSEPCGCSDTDAPTVAPGAGPAPSNPPSGAVVASVGVAAAAMVVTHLLAA